MSKILSQNPSKTIGEYWKHDSWNEQDLTTKCLKKQYGNIRWKRNIFSPTCLAFCKYVCKQTNPCVKYHTCACILADVWLLPNMFGKNQTRWYIYTWVLFSTHVWILTHRYGKRHTCVQKATQLYVCKCLAFSTHVWEKPLTCLFPPELWVWDWLYFHLNSIQSSNFPFGKCPLSSDTFILLVGVTHLLSKEKCINLALEYWNWLKDLPFLHQIS